MERDEGKEPDFRFLVNTELVNKYIKKIYNNYNIWVKIVDAIDYDSNNSKLSNAIRYTISKAYPTDELEFKYINGYPHIKLRSCNMLDIKLALLEKC